MKPLRIDPKTGNYQRPQLPTSDKMLRLALEHPPGSEMRRSAIAAALMLEPRPRGRPRGTVRPPDDSFAQILVWHIAFRTGERKAECLARHAWATGLLHEKATEESATHRLAKRCRQWFSPRVRKELDERAVERGYVEDPAVVVRQLKHDPEWLEWSASSQGCRRIK